MDAEIREKHGEAVEAAAPVETDFAVMYSGAGNGQVGITGEQNGRYEILVMITESGYLGDGHFTYSLDGGETWQGKTDFEIPLSGFYEIPLTGLTIEFAVSYADADGFMEGDVYSASIPDPSTRIRCERTGRGAAMVEVLSVSPDIQAFDALEASGMEFVIDIQKSGSFGEAIWAVSTDGGKTIGSQEYAEEDLLFEDAGVLLCFFPEKDGTLFVRGDRYMVSAVRESSHAGYGLFVFLAVLVFFLVVPLLSKTATGYATFFGYKPIYILTDSMEPVIPAGSWAVAVPACGEEIAVGDVAAYRKENGTKLRPIIIHRVVGITESGFIFQGDNNELPDSQAVRADQIVYKVIYPDVSQE